MINFAKIEKLFNDDDIKIKFLDPLSVMDYRKYVPFRGESYEIYASATRLIIKPTVDYVFDEEFVVSWEMLVELKNIMREGI